MGIIIGKNSLFMAFKPTPSFFYLSYQKAMVGVKYIKLVQIAF